MTEDSSGASSRLLDGVRVLDLSRLMPFSYGTQLLVEAGADVVKVEAPGGEYGRGMHRVFEMTNRGKSSVTVDLRADDGPLQIRRLLRSADVLLESFRPGVMAAMGLGHDDLREEFPHLVYCSASGYGHDGVFSGMPGHDVNYAALAGLLDPAGECSPIPPVPFVDMASGMAVAFGVLAGYVRRLLTGHGTFVEVSMANVAFSLNALGLSHALESGEARETETGSLAGYPWPDLFAGRVPCYGVFDTSDGQRLALANVEPKFWSRFLALVDLPELGPLRFAVGPEADAAIERIRGRIGQKTAAQWEEILGDGSVCVSRVNTAGQALAEEHFRHAGMVAGPGKNPVVRVSPARFRDGATALSHHPGDVPSPGRDNQRLLGDAGAQTDGTREQEKLHGN